MKPIQISITRNSDKTFHVIAQDYKQIVKSLTMTKKALIKYLEVELEHLGKIEKL